MKLHSAHVLAVSSILASALVFACAESATDIPGEEKNNQANNGTNTESSSTLPPSNPAGGSTTSSGGSTSSGGQSTSSGSTTSSSGSTTSSSGGSSGGSGGAPACAWAGDFQKMLSKMTEIQAGAPCDSTCNPATHCCLDLFGGAGASGGTSGGLPLDAGTSSGSGGLPTGGGGTCVSNN